MIWPGLGYTRPVTIYRGTDKMSLKTTAYIIVLASSLGAPLAAWAQNTAAKTTSAYPVKPIRIIAQFTPGTSTGILARVIAHKLTEAWGQQVLVDNRPGAGGVVGTEIGAKATPDGYTLTMGVSSAFGIVAPAKTPDAILGKLNQEILRILQAPDVKERLAALAFTPVGDTRKEFAAFIKSEIAKWGKAIRDSGAKAD